VASLTLADRIAERAGCGLDPGRDVAKRLATYLELLGRWNRKINLTALPLDPPSDASIDRLVIESLVAVTCLPPGGLRMLDIGSGSGSPAIPMKLARPDLELAMVESRRRKSAFLREAVRTLELSQTTVETREFGAGSGEFQGNNRFDVITLRAVAISESILTEIGHITNKYGRLLLFVGSGSSVDLPGWLCDEDMELPSSGGRLLIVRRV
jgi:16S rRNA (guanine527-N7)-methyltransferase